MPQTLLTERDGRVLIVRLHNPPRNLMSPELVGELDELTRSLRSDRSIRAVVLTGAPPETFITHYDVEALLAAGQASPPVDARAAGAALRTVQTAGRLPGVAGLLERTPAAGVQALLRTNAVLSRLAQLDQVVIAAINGLALGGGSELALACDLRYLADRPEARVGQPEVLLGLLPGAGGTQRLARAVGPARALELILEGRALSAREALEVGWVHRTVAPERLLEEALGTAQRLSRRSALSVGAIKRAIYDGAARPLEEGLLVEGAGFMATLASPPAQAAMAELVRQAPSSVAVPPSEYLERLGAWERGEVVDLGA